MDPAPWSDLFGVTGPAEPTKSAIPGQFQRSRPVTVPAFGGRRVADVPRIRRGMVPRRRWKQRAPMRRSSGVGAARREQPVGVRGLVQRRAAPRRTSTMLATGRVQLTGDESNDTPARATEEWFGMVSVGAGRSLHARPYPQIADDVFIPDGTEGWLRKPNPSSVRETGNCRQTQTFPRGGSRSKPGAVPQP